MAALFQQTVVLPTLYYSQWWVVVFAWSSDGNVKVTMDPKTWNLKFIVNMVKYQLIHYGCT
jgi:hypothetical protein